MKPNFTSLGICEDPSNLLGEQLLDQIIPAGKAHDELNQSRWGNITAFWNIDLCGFYKTQQLTEATNDDRSRRHARSIQERLAANIWNIWNICHIMTVDWSKKDRAIYRAS
jgi:hypothetical protein